MKIKNRITSAVAVFALAGFMSQAHAKTEYHVYKKGSSSTCDISTKSPDKFNKGSKWQYVGKNSTRSGAKKIGKTLGCSSF